jgi:hypothetical protein
VRGLELELSSSGAPQLPNEELLKLVIHFEQKMIGHIKLAKEISFNRLTTHHA